MSSTAVVIFSWILQKIPKAGSGRRLCGENGEKWRFGLHRLVVVLSVSCCARFATFTLSSPHSTKHQTHYGFERSSHHFSYAPWTYSNYSSLLNRLTCAIPTSYSLPALSPTKPTRMSALSFENVRFVTLLASSVTVNVYPLCLRRLPCQPQRRPRCGRGFGTLRGRPSRAQAQENKIKTSGCIQGSISW